MFITRAAGLAPAPTGWPAGPMPAMRWQPAGPMPSSRLSAGTGRFRGALCSAVLHVAAVLLAGWVWWGAPSAPPDGGMAVTMVFAPPQMPPQKLPQTRPQQQSPGLPVAQQAAPPPAWPAAPARAVRSPAAPATRPAAPVLQRFTPRVHRPHPVEAAPAPRPPAPTVLDAPASAQAMSAVSAVPAAPDLAALAGFTRQVQTAVQAAALYPPAARRMHVQGRVQLRFDYSGGAVFAIAIAVPGPSPMLDRAALAAVQTAAYPHAPATWEKARLPMVVWVDFHLQTDG